MIETNKHLTKHQRRLLKRQDEEQGRLAARRNKKIKKTISWSLVAILLIGGVVWSVVPSSQTQKQESSINSSDAPKLEINHNEYDAGNVKISGGLIKHAYELKNSGSGDLLIDSIWTSCHCTTAKLTAGGKTSPEFGMDKYRTSQKIAPGETGSLEVTFDPAYHGPAGIGEAVRVIYLSSNDPQNKKAEIKLHGTVVP